MGAFYLKRYQKYFHNLSKYLKYVFNDHLMIILFFLLGGGMLFYANFLKQLTHLASFTSKVILALVVCICLLFGNLKTLFVEADSIFLLPKERKLKSYLQMSIFISYILPVIFLCLVLFIFWPFVKIAHSFTATNYIFFSLTVILLKYFDLLFQAVKCYFRTFNLIFKYLAIILVLLLSLFTSKMIIILALAMILVIFMQIYFIKQNHLLNIMYCIEKETKRMQQVYKWLNLFTDVPEMKVSVKRRKYLDKFVKTKWQKQNAFYLLYKSQIFCGQTYGNLIIRLTLISNLIIIFSKNYILSIFTASLFLFLTLLQLLPLYKELDYIVFSRTYPILKIDKEKSFKQILITTSIIMIILNTLFALISLKIGEICVLILAMCLVYILFSVIYVRPYLKKANFR